MKQSGEPDVKKYFIKILNSISISLFWMMACATAGIYFKLGYINRQPLINIIVFYTAMLITLLLLLRYLYNTWKNG